MKITYLRIALATALAAIILFVIHVYYGHGLAQAYVDAAYKGRPSVVSREPYPPLVFWTAFATEVIPLFGIAVMYLLVQDRLPGRSLIAKGFYFGLVFMFCTDHFVRLPLMNWMVGNRLDVVLVQGLEGWATYPLVGITIAVVIGQTGKWPSLNPRVA